MMRIQRSLSGGGSSSLTWDLENNAEYRIHLARYAKSIYGSRPREARQIWRLLASTPMKPQSRNDGSGGFFKIDLPHPENVERDALPRIPWWKITRRKVIPPNGSGGWTGATEVPASIWNDFPEVPWVCPSFPWVEVEEEDERILIEKLGDKVDQHG